MRAKKTGINQGKLKYARGRLRIFKKTRTFGRPVWARVNFIVSHLANYSTVTAENMEIISEQFPRTVFLNKSFSLLVIYFHRRFAYLGDDNKKNLCGIKIEQKIFFQNKSVALLTVKRLKQYISRFFYSLNFKNASAVSFAFRMMRCGKGRWQKKRD